jgi:hypothetical protein
MITVSCTACGKELHLADAVGGTRVPCTKCGAPVAVPALAETPKGTKTARAVQQALAAMDARQNQPHGDTAASATRTAPAAGKPLFTPAQWKIVAAALAAISLAIGAYAVFSPNQWESSQRQGLLHIKAEAERLEADGKTVEAFNKYGNIVLATANKPIHDAELRKAVEQAREARDRLFPQVRDLEEKAKAAKYAH